MYSFAPLESIPPDHSGFWFVVFACVVIVALNVLYAYLQDTYEEWRSVLMTATIASTVSLIAAIVSYHSTDQTTKTFVNTPVTGKFVGYQPEGHIETVTERVGKTTRQKDVAVHNLYVIYEVEGHPVLFRAREGTAYPKTAILYKN